MNGSTVCVFASRKEGRPGPQAQLGVHKDWLSAAAVVCGEWIKICCLQRP